MVAGFDGAIHGYIDYQYVGTSLIDVLDEAWENARANDLRVDITAYFSLLRELLWETDNQFQKMCMAKLRAAQESGAFLFPILS